MKAFIGMPTYTDMGANPWAVRRATVENGLVGRMPFAFEPACSSALCYTFDLLWAKALAADMDYFFMLHSDIVPEAGWAGKLIDILVERDADVVSACSPIKSGSGVFSCGIGEAGWKWGPKFRLTARQLERLPQTFTAADVGYPDKPLLVNTGCFVVNLRKPWVREVNADGSLKVSFHMDHRIVVDDGKFNPQMESEDWRFSKDVWAAGGRIFGTQAIRLLHFGTKAWSSNAVWGDEEDPLSVKRGIRTVPAVDTGDLPSGWFDFADLYDSVVAGASPADTFVEVGCWKGRSTIYLAKAIADSHKGITLHAIDNWAGGSNTPDNAAGAQRQQVDASGVDLFAEFNANLAKHGVAGSINVVRDDSAEAAKRFGDASVGFVFIDADHAKAAVARDLEAWWPKVRAGGTLAGHDVDEPGPFAAVTEFAGRHGLRWTQHGRCYVFRKTDAKMSGSVYDESGGIIAA